MTRKRAIAIGFEERHLSAFAAEGIDVVCQIGSEPPSSQAGCHFIAARDYVRYQVGKRSQKPIGDLEWERAKAGYFNYFVRCADRYAVTSAMMNDWTDYEMLFMGALEQARDLIDQFGPDCLFFVNYPHRCATVALFAWAQVTGVPSVLSFQTQWPNLTFLLGHWEDLGLFSTAVKSEAKKIDTSPPKSMPFYMSSIRTPSQKVRRSAMKFAEFSARFLASPFMLPGAAGEWRVNRVLDELRNGAQGIAFARNRRLVPAVALESLPERFVYFPLHMQPEMNTDIMGGVWGNQLFALHRLRNFVPEDLTIVVKENPKQTGLMRGRLFWQRLGAFPNVVMAEDSVSSLDLVRQAEFTATITGTAGWEALRSGRPALSFGHVFWSRLPGAFRIGEAHFGDLASFEFDRQRFEAAVGEMSRVTSWGVTDKDYVPIVPDYDPVANAAQVARSFRTHIDARP